MDCVYPDNDGIINDKEAENDDFVNESMGIDIRMCKRNKSSWQLID